VRHLDKVKCGTDLAIGIPEGGRGEDQSGNAIEVFSRIPFSWIFLLHDWLCYYQRHTAGARNPISTMLLVQEIRATTLPFQETHDDPTDTALTMVGLNL
jgi:hypothetical protein